MNTHGGVDVQIHIFLISALVGVEWSASRPCRFTPGERTPGTHWIGGWVDHRAGLDDLEKWKFLTLLGLELGPLGRYTSRYTDCAIPAESKTYTKLLFGTTRKLAVSSVSSRTCWIITQHQTAENNVEFTGNPTWNEVPINRSTKAKRTVLSNGNNTLLIRSFRQLDRASTLVGDAGCRISSWPSQESNFQLSSTSQYWQIMDCILSPVGISENSPTYCQLSAAVWFIHMMGVGDLSKLS
jgi:hypothetical protein